VIDPQTQAILTGIVRREQRSLLTYVRDAFPWTTPHEQDELARLAQIIQEQEQATARLGRFLARHKSPLPYLGAYPMSFTTINFVTLRHLVPLLVDSERQAIAELERTLPLIHDPSARVPVQELLNLKHKHVHALETLHLPSSGTVAAAH
jgi:hypothetical protein